jgi:hypothetical protein
VKVGKQHLTLSDFFLDKGSRRKKEVGLRHCDTRDGNEITDSSVRQDMQEKPDHRHVYH